MAMVEVVDVVQGGAVDKPAAVMVVSGGEVLRRLSPELVGCGEDEEDEEEGAGGRRR